MKRKGLLAVATVAILVIGIAAIASNMGFKIDISLTGGGAYNWVSLPYYNSYTDAGSIFSDVPNCTQVSRWDTTTGAFQTWNGSRGTNFTVDEGEAYLVKVSSASNWIVVGSHDPSFALSLQAGGAYNWVSVPYHTTATDAGTLFSQIPNCSQVSRWDTASGSFQTWNGSRGTNFGLTAGEGLLVKVSTASSWTPAHY